MTHRLAAQTRLRLREEMKRKGLSQRDLSGILEWSQSRVAKLFTGRVEMSLDDLESLCFSLGLSPVEAVRDHGLEFCADMTPLELRVLERWRQMDLKMREHFLALFDVASHTRQESRRAAPERKKRRGVL